MKKGNTMIHYKIKILYHDLPKLIPPAAYSNFSSI